KHYLEKYRLDTVVDVSYHLYNNNNRKNLQRMRELCDELGFSLTTTYALVMPLERVIEKLEGHPSPSTQVLQEKLLVSVEEGIAAAAAVDQESTSDSALSCPFLETQTVINWDLSVPV